MHPDLCSNPELILESYCTLDVQKLLQDWGRQITTIRRDSVIGLRRLPGMQRKVGGLGRNWERRPRQSRSPTAGSSGLIGVVLQAKVQMDRIQLNPWLAPAA